MSIEKTAAWIWSVIGIGVIVAACIYGIRRYHFQRIVEIRASCNDAQRQVGDLQAFEEARAAGVQLSKASRAYGDDLRAMGKVKLSQEVDACYGRLVAAENSFF